MAFNRRGIKYAIPVHRSLKEIMINFGLHSSWIVVMFSIKPSMCFFCMEREELAYVIVVYNLFWYMSMSGYAAEWKRNINQIILGGCSLQQSFMGSFVFLNWMQVINSESHCKSLIVL